ncbi:MAG: putative xanthine dehydrogenase subunit D [Firmicutes bacterium]|nr:putative xanthine dehydrogenase subunit D [Bacillota bacterium]
MNLRWIGKPIPRQDAWTKVTGEVKYMSDLSMPHMLWGRILRSPHPHALIKSIDIAEAVACPGVVAVLTHRDVPGLNAYGIVVQDQPVLCGDKVRFVGDAVAVLAAESKEAADHALGLIKVEYELLPGVFDPEVAMQQGSPAIHAKGNVLRHSKVHHGDVEGAFADSAVVVEREYRTSRPISAFLETEGGMAMLGADGVLTVYCGAQYPDRDVIQIARALGLERDKVRMVSTLVGGGFGGKDEITVQIHLALLAQMTKRPIKLVLSREESMVTGWKKHPMIVRMKTGASIDGTLLAHEVSIISDTGAYASLGGTILHSAMEHCSGPYRVPNVRVEGHCVYTNNSISGAMRGFGVNQVTFAMETQMDILAEELGLDRLDIRIKNGLKDGDKGALGSPLVTAMGPVQTLQAAGQTELWSQRETYKAEPSRPWKKRGVGLAAAIKGCGLGFRMPDFGAASVELLPSGFFRVRVGCPEIGQGNTIAFAQMAAEVLGCSVDQVEVVTGDTGETPDSGTSTASRSIYVAGNAIIDAATKVVELVEQGISARLVVDVEEVELGEAEVRAGDAILSYLDVAALLLQNGQTCCAAGRFDAPKATEEVPSVYGLPHLVFGTNAHVALVEVDTLTGQVEVLQVSAVSDAGRVINLQGLEGQSEGGTVMGMGYALTEDIIIDQGMVRTLNFNNYIIPTAMDTPPISTTVVEVVEKTGPFGAKGVGEVVCISITPAITNAIYDAIKVRVTELPATIERVLAGLQGV